jgi:hypothetical protein
VPPHGHHSAVDACHTPFVIAIAHDATRQRLQGHPLLVGQLHIAGVEIRLEVLHFRRSRQGQDVFTTTDDLGERDLRGCACLCRGHRFDLFRERQVGGVCLTLETWGRCAPVAFAQPLCLESARQHASPQR